jgi:integrase/recombinase XerD
MKAGMAISSQARYLTAVRCLFQHLLHQELIHVDPTEMVELPRPSYLSIEEVDKLIAAPDRSTPVGLRDAAMLDLAYATGLRVSELVRVRLGDVDFDAGYLRTVGRGGRSGSCLSATERSGSFASTSRCAVAVVSRALALPCSLRIATQR